MPTIHLIPCQFSPRVDNIADFAAGLLAIQRHGIAQTMHIHPADIQLIESLPDLSASPMPLPHNDNPSDSPKPGLHSTSTRQSESTGSQQQNPRTMGTPAAKPQASHGKDPSQKSSGASPASSSVLSSRLQDLLPLMLPKDRQGILTALEALHTVASGRIHPPTIAHTNSAPSPTAPSLEGLQSAKAMLRAALRSMAQAGGAASSMESVFPSTDFATPTAANQAVS
jgi:hypothetical protein